MSVGFLAMASSGVDKRFYYREHIACPSYRLRDVKQLRAMTATADTVDGQLHSASRRLIHIPLVPPGTELYILLVPRAMLN